MVAIFLFLSNIFLNCFFGPHRNIDENKDMMLPIAVKRKLSEEQSVYLRCQMLNTMIRSTYNITLQKVLGFPQ